MSIFAQPSQSLRDVRLDLVSGCPARGGSQLSLESLCSSGYDSAQGDSRTPTPTHLPSDELSDTLSLGGSSCTLTNAHPPQTTRLSLHLPLSFKEPHNPVAEDDAVFSTADSLSICSCSTTFSCYPCSTCNDCTVLQSSSFNTPSPAHSSTPSWSHDTLLDTDKEHEYSTDSVASQMIHKLKRHSDRWTGPLVNSTDPIVSRLKYGRAEAIKRQEIIEAFLSEASSQLEIQSEASSAQAICLNGDKSEYFEAERLILLAGERYAAYISQAQQLVSELGHSLTPECESLQDKELDHPCPATLYLDGIKLILCDDFVRQLRSSLATHYCLCLVKEAKTKGITATHIGHVSSKCSSNTFRIEFNNCFTLPWMPQDFQLDIEVYHLATNCASQLFKRKFMNVITSLAQRSPAVVSRCKPRRLLGSCVHPVTTNDGESKKVEPLLSKFQKIGCIRIDKSSLKQRVYNLTEPSNVICAVQVHLQADPDLTAVLDDLPLQGYLNVFGGVEWERRWFILSSQCLSYWFYPDQPGLSEPPVRTWNLDECGSLAELADPSDCGWEHAFVLPLKTDNSDKIIVSAESEAQLVQWMTIFNTLSNSSETPLDSQRCTEVLLDLIIQ